MELKDLTNKPREELQEIYDGVMAQRRKVMFAMRYKDMEEAERQAEKAIEAEEERLARTKTSQDEAEEDLSSQD